MSEIENSIADYEELLRQQEIHLIELKSEIWTFLDEDHSLADIKQKQTKVRTAERNIGNINRALLVEKRLWKEQRGETDVLHKKGAELLIYTKDMSKALADEYADLKRTTDNEKFDALKELTAFIAIPGALIGYAKARNGSVIDVEQAATVGVMIAIPFTARKKLPGIFRAAAKTICDAPREIKNSFMLYHLKETAKDHGRAAMRLF